MPLWRTSPLYPALYAASMLGDTQHTGRCIFLQGAEGTRGTEVREAKKRGSGGRSKGWRVRKVEERCTVALNCLNLVISVIRGKSTAKTCSIRGTYDSLPRLPFLSLHFSSLSLMQSHEFLPRPIYLWIYSSRERGQTLLYLLAHMQITPFLRKAVVLLYIRCKHVKMNMTANAVVSIVPVNSKRLFCILGAVSGYSLLPLFHNS